MDRLPKSGIHLPHTANNRVLTPFEYEALGLLWPGSVSLLDYQLTGDAQLERWLRRRAQDGLQVYVRLYAAVKPDPAQHAARLADIVRHYPYATGWLPANEPNIEWPGETAEGINQWCTDFWYNANYYRVTEGLRFRLYWPPIAQDAPLSHTALWNSCASSINLFLDSGGGIAWHDYYDPAQPLRMLEQEMPGWLHDRLPFVPTLIHECGRKPGIPADFLALGPELINRYGNHNMPGSGHTVADAITPWLLSDSSGAFDGHAWQDQEGGFRQVCFDWRAFGP